MPARRPSGDTRTRLGSPVSGRRPVTWNRSSKISAAYVVTMPSSPIVRQTPRPAPKKTRSHVSPLMNRGPSGAATGTMPIRPCESSETRLRTITKGGGGGAASVGSGRGPRVACRGRRLGPARYQQRVAADQGQRERHDCEEGPGPPGHGRIIPRSARASAQPHAMSTTGSAVAKAVTAAVVPHCAHSHPNATEATSRARLVAVATRPRPDPRNSPRQRRAGHGRQHPVGGGVVPPEQDQCRCHAHLSENRHQQDHVEKAEQAMSGQEHLPAGHAVGQQADGEREHQVNGAGADEQQRHGGGRDPALVLQCEDEVDEGIADGDGASAAPASTISHSLPVPSQLGELTAERRPPPETRFTAGGFRTNSTRTASPTRATAKLTTNTRSKRPGATASSDERDERAEHGSGRVHGAVHAERGAEVLRGGAQRDERVARSGADALADAVRRDRRGDERRAGADRQPRQAADRGRRITDGRQLLVPRACGRPARPRTSARAP